MAKRSIWIILAGIYFILAGAVLLGHGYYPKLDRQLKQRLYQNVERRQDQMGQIMARGQFWSENDRAMFIEHHHDLQAAIHNFKQGQLEQFSPVVLLISVVGMLAGIFYLLTGLNLFAKPLIGEKMAWGAFGLWALYLGLFMWNACVEIRFLDYSSVEFWQMTSFYKPDTGDLRYEPLVKFLINFSVTRTAVFAFIWIMVYLMAPLYLLTRVRPKQIKT